MASKTKSKSGGGTTPPQYVPSTGSTLTSKAGSRTVAPQPAAGGQTVKAPVGSGKTANQQARNPYASTPTYGGSTAGDPTGGGGSVRIKAGSHPTRTPARTGGDPAGVNNGAPSWDWQPVTGGDPTGRNNGMPGPDWQPVTGGDPAGVSNGRPGVRVPAGNRRPSGRTAYSMNSAGAQMFEAPTLTSTDVSYPPDYAGTDTAGGGYTDVYPQYGDGGGYGYGGYGGRGGYGSYYDQTPKDWFVGQQVWRF